MVRECKVEQCWVLIGDVDNMLWWGHRRRKSSGERASVAFDANYVMRREEELEDILGFYHTHPGMIAVPSSRDLVTMRAWVSAFGKSLICCIRGCDGLRAFWFDDDESDYVECQVKQFGNLLVGCTEPMEINNGPEQIPSRGDQPGQGPNREVVQVLDNDLWSGGVREPSYGFVSEGGVQQTEGD